MSLPYLPMYNEAVWSSSFNGTETWERHPPLFHGAKGLPTVMNFRNLGLSNPTMLNILPHDSFFIGLVCDEGC